MKTNQKLIIALAAGAAAISAVAFLWGTEKGSSFTKKLQEKSKDFTGTAENIFNKAKKNINSLKEKLACKANSNPAEEFQ